MEFIFTGPAEYRGGSMTVWKRGLGPVLCLASWAYGADAGIEKDYPTYRMEHRSLLHDYLELFVVHGGPN